MSLFYQLKQNQETKDVPVIMLTGIADDIGIKFTGEGIEANSVRLLTRLSRNR